MKAKILFAILAVTMLFVMACNNPFDFNDDPMGYESPNQHPHNHGNPNGR
jgi:hypothetical protein